MFSILLGVQKTWCLMWKGGINLGENLPGKVHAELRKVYLRMVTWRNNTVGKTLTGNSHFANYLENLLLKGEDGNPNKQTSEMINLGKQVSKLIGWLHGNSASPPPATGVWLGSKSSSDASLEWKIDGGGRNAGADVIAKVVLQFPEHWFRPSLFPLEKKKTLRVLSHSSQR